MGRCHGEMSCFVATKAEHTAHSKHSINGNIPQCSSEPSLQSTSPSHTNEGGRHMPSLQRKCGGLQGLPEAFMTLSTKKACQFHKNKPSTCRPSLDNCTSAREFNWTFYMHYKLSKNWQWAIQRRSQHRTNQQNEHATGVAKFLKWQHYQVILGSIFS